MKYLALAILIIAILIGGGFLLARDTAPKSQIPGNNVSTSDGKQIIEIRAKGGYLPRKSVAKAGVPTILHIVTSGTFDCSSAVRIPSLDISMNLPASGATDIPLGTPQSGILKGSCGMGMYPFSIEFKN